jgi:hypothetical protein
LKKNEAGEVVKHKAQLVARGFVQQAGIDFDEAFAPVARMESIRLLLALVAQEGWPVHHMDVKSTFLNGELKEEVYVKQPPGFVVTSHMDVKSAFLNGELKEVVYVKQPPGFVVTGEGKVLRLR